MTIILNGALINGDIGGTLAVSGRLQNLQISTAAALVGSLTLTGCGGSTMVANAGLNGVMPGGELYGPVFFVLSNPADVGKARVTWSAT